MLSILSRARIIYSTSFRTMVTSQGIATAATPAKQDLGATMPPNYNARPGELQTFELPAQVTGTPKDVELGKALVDAWRSDGILQISMTDTKKSLMDEVFAASKGFFRKPHSEKAACVDSQSYSGYIASAEEITDGIPDYSEIFTVTKDLDLSETRVKNHWPCHGPCPWPDLEMKDPMEQYMKYLGQSGEKLLQLIECGLGIPPGSLTKYTSDGWHHMRILRYVYHSSNSAAFELETDKLCRFPAVNNTNGKGKEGRGIGSHTDYGLLVIAAQDEVGG